MASPYFPRGPVSMYRQELKRSHKEKLSLLSSCATRRILFELKMCLRFLSLWRQDPRLHGRLKEARAPWEIDVLRKLIGYILFSYPLDILLSPKSIDLPHPSQKSLDREVKTDHFLTYGGTSLQCGFCQFENVH